MAFVFRAVDEVGAALNCALVVMGDRLGYYRALAALGPTTPAELADSTDTGLSRAGAEVVALLGTPSSVHLVSEDPPRADFPATDCTLNGADLRLNVVTYKFGETPPPFLAQYAFTAPASTTPLPLGATSADTAGPVDDATGFVIRPCLPGFRSIAAALLLRDPPPGQRPRSRSTPEKPTRRAAAGGWGRGMSVIAVRSSVAVQLVVCGRSCHASVPRCHRGTRRGRSRGAALS
jgi:hypothetical protein